MPDTEHYLSDMRLTTLEYARKWNMAALNIGLAYSAAYQAQQTALGNIKKTIEAKKKQEEAMMTFTLSLLTGGVVGPIADRVVKKFMKGGELSTIKDVAGKVTEDSLLTEWTGNAFKELVKTGDEKLRGLGVDKLKSEVSTNGFEPAGITPHDYTASVQLGIEQRADAMSDIARTIHREYYYIPADIAYEVHKSFLASPFFTEAPGELKKADLQVAAELMLWIAWGKLREVRYWDVQYALSRSHMSGKSEMWDWAPLLKELQRLGAPTKTFTMDWFGFLGKPMTTINMPEFIKWAKGATAPKAAFDRVPTKADSVKDAIKKHLTKLN